MSSLVELDTSSLGVLLGYTLNIPEYQRDYCWGDKQVETLLENIAYFFQYSETGDEYRMGTVILQKQSNDNEYDVIDGQQRLTTLALLIYELTNTKEEKYSIIADSRLVTTKSQNAISNSLFLIKRFLKKRNIDITQYPSTTKITNCIKNKITFSVLILDKDTSLDLAFTFFSNTNSRGKPLSDYDLLKAHHLRYFSENDESKADFLASRWDELIDPYNNEEKNPIYIQVLDLYIFRLRHFLEGKTLNEKEPQRIYEEFKAAPVIDEIAPFGERFHYAESIQGGAYFFNYVDIMIGHGKEFGDLPEVKKLYNNFTSSRDSHINFAKLTAAHLFAYYLKFGKQYIPEAMMMILRVIGQFRIYHNVRVDYSKLLEYKFNNRICHMVEHATSPTFFLAEIKSEIEKLNFCHEKKKEEEKSFDTEFKYEISNGICKLNKPEESKGKITADFITRYLNLLKDIEHNFKIDSIKKTVNFDYLEVT